MKRLVVPKLLILLGFPIISNFSASGQNSSLEKSEAEFRDLQKSSKFVAIQIKDSISSRQITDNSRLELKDILSSENLISDGQVVLIQDGSTRLEKTRVEKGVEEISENLGGTQVEVFDLGEDTKLILINEFILQFRDTASEKTISAYFTNHPKIQNQVKDSYIQNRYIIQFSDFVGVDSLSKHNMEHLEPVVEFIEPNTTMITDNSAFMAPATSLVEIPQLPEGWPNDADLVRQWYLRNTGLPDGTEKADINIFDGWKLSQGENIRIAILDNGIDEDHLEFAGKIYKSFNAITGIEGRIEPGPLETHGTACAGIAAALSGNEKGICGIAPSASLISVKIASAPSPTEKFKTNPAIISRGIIWAADSGARILSCSWGGGISNNAINEAIDYAVKKKCILIFSAGNSSRAIQYPANLPNVISVGATNQWDEFKTKRTQDHQKNWGSSYGATLSIIAPGVKLYTTDLLGEKGVDLGDYAEFSGTSASTPVVAGAVALMLSKNPDLTLDEIKKYMNNFSDPVRFIKGSKTYTFNRLNIKKLLDGVISGAVQR